MSSEIQEYGKKERINKNIHIRYKKQNKVFYRNPLLIGIVALIVLIVVIVASLSKCSNEESKDTKKETTVGEKESSKTEETSQQTIDNLLKTESKESQIYTLVTSYIDAAYVKCDETMLEEVMDSTENIDLQKNEVRQRYIEAYNDVQVYVLDGTEDINVIFVSYNAKLYNYEDMLPSGEMLMIKKDLNGNYLIHNIEVGEQFEKQMTNEKQIEELGKIKEKIQSEYNAVIESNSEIKSIVDILNGAKNQ